jgi:signal transduction histidine kinase
MTFLMIGYTNMKALLNEIKSLSGEVLTAILTWLVISAITLYSMKNNVHYDALSLLVVGSLLVIFIVSFIYSTSDTLLGSKLSVKIHMLVQIAVVVALYFILPVKYSPILATIWAAQLPMTFSFRQSVALSGLASVPIVIAYGWHWQFDAGWVTGLVYWMFAVFAVTTMDRARREALAKDQANQLNRELLATQSLLSEATKQSERLRISRNIHDLVGHHLTALTINLQVASHLSEGEAKSAVDKSHAIAKLLLSDVRSAVSEIRQMSALDLSSALEQLFEHTPRVTIDCQFPENLVVEEVAVAEVVLFVVQEALTNTLKHSDGLHIWFEFVLDDEGGNSAECLLLKIKNDGCAGEAVVWGNGLTGMRERVEAIGGELMCDSSRPYFTLNLRIPLTI